MDFFPTSTPTVLQQLAVPQAPKWGSESQVWGGEKVSVGRGGEIQEQNGKGMVHKGSSIKSFATEETPSGNRFEKEP